MAFGNLKRAVRFLLGALCAVLLVSLGAQAYSLKSTEEQARKAQELGAAIALSMDSDVEGPDLSRYQNLARSSIFYSQRNKDFKAPQLEGLVGGYALLDGRMHAEGDRIDGWTVAQITENEVVLSREEDGEKFEQKLSLYQNSPTLEIDNRPKNQQKTVEPRQFPGPEGPKSSRLAEWRQRNEQMKKERGPEGPPGPMPKAPQFGGAGSYEALVDAIDGMSNQELEQAVRQRYGGNLPQGFDPEKVRQLVHEKGKSKKGKSKN